MENKIDSIQENCMR